MEIKSKQQILERRKEIEQELVEMLKETESDFTLDHVRDAIYNEEDNDDMMKVVAMFDRGGDASELENVLELVTDAWNYFPHKVLGGISPAEQILKQCNKKNMAEYKATTKDNKCIFCEIVAGNIQTAGKFWEDKEFMAWLAIDPNTEGFTCVIPKQHFGSDVLKMPDDVLQRFIIASKKVANILENYFEDVGRVGLIMEGTGIDHAHIKLVPMHGTENLKKGVWKQVLSGKNFWFEKYEGWISSGSGPMADPADLKKLASKLIESQKKYD